MWHHASAFPADLRRRIEQLGHHAEAGFRTASVVASAAPCHGECRRSWRFPTDETAERWNREWDRVQTGEQAIHPAFITIGGRSIADPYLDGLARIAGAVLTQEVQAGTPWPLMTAGWRYDMTLRYSALANCAGGSEKSLEIRLSGEVRDTDRELLWSSDAVRTYPASLIPTSVATLWSRRRWSPVEEIYA